MESPRQAFDHHLKTIRGLILEVASVDSGIYDATRAADLLREPGRIIQLETTWIQSLVDLLHLMERYVRLVERWTSHVAGLMQNLGASEEEILRAQRMQLTVAELFRHKQYDPEYLRWILTDVSDEVDRLVAESQDLVSDTPRLVKLADQFGGPLLERVKQIALVWMSEDRRGFYAPLLGILQEAHGATKPSELLLKLLSYLEGIRTLAASTPMFVRPDTSVSYSSDELEASHQLVEQLSQGVENLTTFVGLRTETYMLVLQHEEVLMRAARPTSPQVSEPVAPRASDRSQPADRLLPYILAEDALPLAVQLAEEALMELDAKIDAAGPYFDGALLLNNLLQSPATAKFLAADQRRLELYRERRPQISASFERLRAAIKSLG